MKTRVMIVEDQEMQRALIGDALSDSGRYEVVSSIDNADLSDLYVDGGGIDLVLMDIYTAFGADGLDASERIKQAHPEVKIIIMTSMPETGWITRALDAGVESFWFKEIVPESIVGICDRTMDGESVYPVSA